MYEKMIGQCKLLCGWLLQECCRDTKDI